MSPETLPLGTLWSGHPWRRVLVYGLGLSGRAAAALLLDRGIAVAGVDARPAEELDLGDLAGRSGFELVAGGEAAELPADADALILSPGVPPDRPLVAAARRRGLAVLAEVELAFPLLGGPVAAITGSNGKSTTTALAGAMLAAGGAPVEVCGNIGEPLAARVDGPPGRTFVVELSSFQLESIHHFHPRAAALLNLAPDHLDRYGDMAAYAEAKAAIFSNQQAGDVAVLNADDPLVAAAVTRARRRFFSRRGEVSDGCYLDGERVVEVAPGQARRHLFSVGDLAITGVHNLENAMAAALVAVALGTEPPHLRAALAAFTGLPHRLERVAEAGGVTFYDDSKGTNPAATVKSIEGFPDGAVHLILGGRAKGADPAELADTVAHKARRLYLIGEAAGELEAALGHLVPTRRCGTLEAAVDAAADAAAAGEVVVLSPAYASFDQFRNFVHRGQCFQELVRRRLGPSDAGGHPTTGGRP